MCSLNLPSICLLKLNHSLLLLLHVYLLLIDQFFNLLYKYLSRLKIKRNLPFSLSFQFQSYTYHTPQSSQAESARFQVLRIQFLSFQRSMRSYLMLIRISEHLLIIPPYSKLKSCSFLLRSMKCIEFNHPSPLMTSQQSSLCILMLYRLISCDFQ